MQLKINEVSRATGMLQITQPIYSVAWNSHITPLRSFVLNISGARKHVFSRRMDKNNISLGSVAGIHFRSWCNIRHGSDGKTEDAYHTQESIESTKEIKNVLLVIGFNEASNTIIGVYLEAMKK